MKFINLHENARIRILSDMRFSANYFVNLAEMSHCRKTQRLHDVNEKGLIHNNVEHFTTFYHKSDAGASL